MTFELSSIKPEIKSYILQEVYAKNGKINNKTLIFKEGYFDSMGFMRLISWIEEEFSIKTGDEDLTEENFESIDAITGFVCKKLQL